MGGNSKIALEAARCLSDSAEVHFVVPEEKIKTLDDSIGRPPKLLIHTLPAFNKDDKRHPIDAIRHNLGPTRELFTQLDLGEGDIVFAISDFHIDVISLYRLQREFNFKWLPSVFLFVPFIIENLVNGYRFPPVKYLIYWFYQRTLFGLMKRRATGFVVTNESDYHYFPKRFSGKLFAYYGGVNVDQIPNEPPTKKYDVVFCSRLHPQKGIDSFLDVWKQVLAMRSESQLAIIGNGSEQYEAYLKEKAKDLGISQSIEWLGYVNNEAKFRIYSASRVFVHPTVFDNNGMVAAEALCSGLPVVMQDLPSLRSVYTTGCIKVPFGDKDAFARAIVDLLGNPDLYAATAPSASDIAGLREKWRWESRAGQFLEFLRGL